MRRALYLPPFGTFGDVNLLVELAVAAEHAGWDGFYLWDHVLHDTPVPLADAWIALTAVAAATNRIRIGPLVTPLARRRPWKVAREAVTLDHLSGGRLVLGVGLGIDFWREFSAFAEPARDDKERAVLVDEGIEIITQLWSGEPVSFRGTRLSVDGARFLPTPLQQPRIPIWSAALWPPREGPLRRAARCDGVMPFGVAGPLQPDDVRTLCTEITNRRASDGPFDVCVYGPADRADEYEAAGTTWLVESFLWDEPLAEVRRLIDRGP